MEPDSRTYNENLEKASIRKLSNNMSDDGNVPQSVGVRYPFLFGSTLNQFILDYHISFLPWCSALLWIIFLIA
jgi:hypothetical protein